MTMRRWRSESLGLLLTMWRRKMTPDEISHPLREIIHLRHRAVAHPFNFLKNRLRAQRNGRTFPRQNTERSYDHHQTVHPEGRFAVRMRTLDKPRGLAWLPGAPQLLHQLRKFLPRNGRIVVRRFPCPTAAGRLSHHALVQRIDEPNVFAVFVAVGAVKDRALRVGLVAALDDPFVLVDAFPCQGEDRVRQGPGLGGTFH